jgi:hypothetical protein
MISAKYCYHLMFGLVFICNVANAEIPTEIFAQQDHLLSQSQSKSMLAAATPAKTSTKTPEGATGGSHQYTQAQINEMANNPLGELWMLFIQNDATFMDGDIVDFLGEDEKFFNTTTIEPVMPFQLTENWDYIFRPVLPIHYWDAPSASFGPPTHYPGGTLPVDVDWDDQLELGDIVLWNAFATNEMVKPPNIFGFGATLMLDTATDDIFGTGKWSAGPMGLAVHVGPPKGWIFGAIAQHWWSYAGDDNREDVNLTDI